MAMGVQCTSKVRWMSLPIFRSSVVSRLSRQSNGCRAIDLDPHTVIQYIPVIIFNIHIHSWASAIKINIFVEIKRNGSTKPLRFFSYITLKVLMVKKKQKTKNSITIKQNNDKQEHLCLLLSSRRKKSEKLFRPFHFTCKM